MRPIDGDALKITLDTFTTIVGFSGVYDRGQVMECIDAAPTVATDTNVLGKWISVKDRLPKENEAVNITWVNRNPVSYYSHIKDMPFVATGVYFRGGWYWWSSTVQDLLGEYGRCDIDLMDEAIEVTHWMPLPEPPKEVSGDACIQTQ